MTIKKRMFVSNAAIVFISLVMLLAIFAGVLEIAEETSLSRFDDLQSITIVDKNGETIVLDNSRTSETRRGDRLYEYRKIFTQLFVMFLIIGIAAIAVILALSSLFTRLMIKRIMEPVETLTAAANRVRYENLDEPIEYKNNDEFKEVCNTFDEMQVHLKEGIEKNLAYENARITMVTDISHDLRTPLTSVKGFLKGMLDGVADTPEKQRAYLDIAYKKACSMDVLLDKLFYFSKLETDNMPIYKSTVVLKSYISAYTEGMQPELRGRNADISFSCGDGKYISMLDREQMNRVLDNLVENSLKYNEKVKIDITLKDENYNNVIIFSDNGAGVPEEDLPRLFDQFYRVDKSRAENGSGLGLYIVKKVIAAHGGAVSAANDNGLQITIKLPKAAEDYRNEKNSDN